ncbi:hypothetical protein Tco_0930048, partial [Tanacetum coccineum]
MGVEGIANMALSPCEVGLDWDGDGFVLCCRGYREEEVEDPVMAIWRQNRTFNVIIRMDWLSECDAVIVC